MGMNFGKKNLFIPHQAMHKFFFDRLLIRPSVLDFFSQPAKLLLQGIDLLVNVFLKDT